MEATKQDDDAQLSDFLATLLEYNPTIPDELVEYYLSKSGFQCPDIRVTRLVSIATQRFIAEIASDALQLSKLRQPSTKEKRDKQTKDKQLVLTTEDLALSLQEYGVTMKKQEYYMDIVNSGMTSSKEKSLE